MIPWLSWDWVSYGMLHWRLGVIEGIEKLDMQEYIEATILTLA
jgi:hypothetical protein